MVQRNIILANSSINFILDMRSFNVREVLYLFLLPLWLIGRCRGEYGIIKIIMMIDGKNMAV